MLHRAYTKPLGYAGDFSVMLHIYKDSFEGDSAFGQVFHKLACEEPLSAGVRTRKDLIKRLTAREHARRRDEGEPLRAMSLGCGPAREVVEYLDECETPPAGIHWTLIDQEEKALSVAYHDVLRGIDARQADCTAQCLYLSFEQLIRLQGTLPAVRRLAHHLSHRFQPRGTHRRPNRFGSHRSGAANPPR